MVIKQREFGMIRKYYKLVGDTDIVEFEAKIYELCNKGWELYGSPTTQIVRGKSGTYLKDKDWTEGGEPYQFHWNDDVNGNQFVCYYQAMTFEEEIEDNLP